jgi:cysteine desulfurase family protein (TIGR01976 family)
MSTLSTSDHYIRTHVDAIRERFPALARSVDGQPVVFLDGPAGTQVPQCVMDAMCEYLTQRNANHEGVFVTSLESDAMLNEAHQAMADLLGADDPDCVFFGQNMTSLTFAMSRSLARRWQSGDEIVVTRLDHDANVTPWVMAAEDAGATVRYVDINKTDCTLDLDDFRNKINANTRLVAVGCASNASGSVNPVREICQWARAVGAISFLDAVHFAPHVSIDVAEFGCDFLACSAYKFFGPHTGIMWGRRELLEELVAYKVRPSSNELPGKWMTGTQSHESIAGTLAAVEYLVELGRDAANDPGLARRVALRSAYAAIADYESELTQRLLSGLEQLDAITVWGITDAANLDQRLPTVSITHNRLTATEVAEQLAERGIFVWNGNYYALQLTETLGLEPDGMVRIGLAHYNTAEEVDRLLGELASMS